MRRQLVAALLAVCCTGPLAHAAEGSAFDRFRVPEHRARHFDASFYGRLDHRSSDELGVASSGSSGDGTFSASGRGFSDTEQRQWDAGLQGAVTGNRATSTSLSTSPNLVRDASGYSRDLRELLSGSAALREYPASIPLGVELSLFATLSDRQRWTHDQTDETTLLNGVPLSEYESVNGDAQYGYEQRVTGSVGFGLGRVRDASGVYAAGLLEQRWLKDGALGRPLSEGARARLAQLLSIQSAYRSAHERPDKAFWRDVEALLRDDGALAVDGLGAYASLHALDRIGPGRSLPATRLTGFFFGPRFVTQHTHGTERTEFSHAWRTGTGGTPGPWTESRFGSRWASWTDLDVLLLAAEWHLALGMPTHMDASGSAGADVRGLRRHTEATASLTMRHWIEERWAMGVTLEQQRERTEGPHALPSGPRSDSWSSTGSAELQYFLEDHWSVNLLGTLYRTVRDVPSGTSYRYADLRLGCSYNRGALDAPGLINPVRPLN